MYSFPLFWSLVFAAVMRCTRRRRCGRARRAGVRAATPARCVAWRNHTAAAVAAELLAVVLAVAVAKAARVAAVATSEVARHPHMARPGTSLRGFFTAWPRQRVMLSLVADRCSMMSPIVVHFLAGAAPFRV